MANQIRSIWGAGGMVKMQPSTAHTAGMRRSTKDDKLLGSSKKTFTVREAIIVHNGSIRASGQTVRRFDAANGTAVWGKYKLQAIGGDSNGYTTCFRII